MRKLINKVFDSQVTLILCITGLIMLTAAISVEKFSSLGDETPTQRPSVVKVEMEFRSHRVGAREFQIETNIGSGTVVAEDQILTNYHVIRGHLGAKNVVVTFKDGTRRDAVVVKTDIVNDLALLKIAPVLIDPVKFGAPVEREQAVTIAGFSGGEVYTEVTGKVVGWAAPTPLSPDTIFKVDRAARDGMSGGPVFNESGEMVGVLFGSLDYANCITIDKVQQFLRR